MASIVEPASAALVSSQSLLVDEPASATPLFTTASRICGVCAKQFAQYKCPACAVQYCSVACYRGHSERCTEQFYATQVNDELRQTHATDDQRRQMARTLRSFEEQEQQRDDAGDESSDSDGDDADDADADADGEPEEQRVARLAALLERSTLDEAALTSAERAVFRRLLADGSLGAAQQAAPVWWERLPPRAVVRAAAGWRAASAETAAAAAAARAPAAPASLPTLASLTRRDVPAALRFTLVEFVLAYAYVVRLFCAAPDDDAPAAAAALVALCASLDGEVDGAHASADEALLRFGARAARPAVATSAAFVAAVAADAARILDDDGAVALALAGARELLDAASAAAARPPKGGGGRAALRRATRKLGFFEAWWAHLDASERRVAAAGLQFALRRDAERRDEMRRAAAEGGAAPAAAREGPLVSEVT